MKLIRIIIIQIVTINFCHSQTPTDFWRKVFESGSQTHFGNVKECEFFLECDCCSGKILFPSTSFYYLVNYCMSDIIVTKGTYAISDSVITLSSDGSRVSREYNWEREVNPKAKMYFVKDSTIAKYQVKYQIGKCKDNTLLIGQGEYPSVAIETDLNLQKEFDNLKLNGLMALTTIPRPFYEVREETLKAFLNGLKNAVNSKDKDFIIKSLSPNIQNSFGGDGGIEEFKEYWNWDAENSQFWGVIEKILDLGGGIYDGGSSYSMPYVSSNWPGHELFDVFDHAAITGTRVNVRDKPNLKTSKVLGQFNYNIVKVDYDKSYPPFGQPKIKGVKYIGDKEWYFVQSLDGKLQGFVYWSYVWSPVGYRFGLARIDGVWKITYLLAGD